MVGKPDSLGFTRKPPPSTFNYGWDTAQQYVIQIITRTVDAVSTSERQILDVCAQYICETSDNTVRPFLCVFYNCIRGIKQIGVIARATSEYICTRATIQHIVSAIASDTVIQAISCPADVGIT